MLNVIGECSKLCLIIASQMFNLIFLAGNGKLHSALAKYEVGRLPVWQGGDAGIVRQRC